VTTPPPLRPDHALFLDFDGTLVEIAPSPDSIVLDPMLPAALSRLADRLGGALALVSGRPIADIDRWLAPLRLPSAGVHGAERRDGDGQLSAVAPPELAALADRLEALVREHPGLLLERKSASVALHYRQAPALEALCRAALAELLAPLPGLRLLQGKQVLEVLPPAVGKGQAIEAFLREPPFAGRRPLFVGDDVTDEDGFEAVQRHGGIAVKVGPGESGAACRLDSPAAVRQWLFAAAGLAAEPGLPALPALPADADRA
jgi:trehalose 6-phosphate phosphatase